MEKRTRRQASRPYSKLRRAPDDSMSHTGTMNPTRLICSCGKRTDLICFFADGNAHGVCEKCATVRLIRLETGQVVFRLVCERCWEKRPQPP